MEKIINHYIIKYNGTEYRYNAETAVDALEKFGNRKVFGNWLIFDYTISLYDASTRGTRWVEAYTTGSDGNRHRIMVSMRIIGLSNKFSIAFRKCITENYLKPFDMSTYNSTISNIYRRYQTTDLVHMAGNINRYRISDR